MTDRPVRAGGFDRASALERLANETFDVLVVGGGITGCGVALDAASRGLSTALIERQDFASGTSSKSSKMVHGGIRYLQQREVRLVYENLAERQRLLENAPHLVSVLPFLIPLFGNDGVVSRAVARSYSSALWAYDFTGGLRIGHRHRRVSKAEALAHLPTLDTDHLVAGFLYYDARADDARLTLSILRTAVVDYGATAVNYAPAVGLLTDGDRVCGAVIAPEGGDQIEVSARSVVNATGVWADKVAGLESGSPAPLLRPAKGVHVTVRASRLPCDVAAVVPVPHDRRSIFVVPWPEADLVYVGTTDTDYDGPLDDPRCTAGDVAYLLSAVNAATTAALSTSDVTGVWAGLRPLLAPPEGRPHSERTADLSRRHTVTTSAHGLVTVTGGKLTTYRKMAQDTLDAVVAVLERQGGVPATGRRCVTRRLRLRGAGDGRPPSAAADDPLVAHLWRRYGTEAGAVLALTDERPSLAEPIVDGLSYLGAEVVFAARAEMARTVTDVLTRRTRASLQDARAAASAAPAVARLLGPELGWDDAQEAEQAQSFAVETTETLAAAGLGGIGDRS